MSSKEHVHFIGIGGYGMSAIAKVMLEKGYHVSGSDVAKQDLTESLRISGAQVYIGHKAEQIQGADVVVYSTALPTDNDELVAARNANLPVLHRSEMLAKLLNEGKGIAIAGAHGKTTTSSMITLVMVKSDADPTFFVGGEIIDLGCNARAGQGEYIVAEADESDGTFLHYHPHLALVNNIEADHLENYQGDFELLKKAYIQFMNQVKPGGKAIVCQDDEVLRSISPQINRPMITYGIDQVADYQASNLILGDRKVSFTVHHQAKELGTIELSVPGRHNVYNALATLVTCLEAGLSFEQVAKAIVLFTGAKRRFQVLADVSNILVVDDYAHHPTEIDATLRAAKQTGKRVIAVFQPQRYTRTFYLFEEFSRAFREADYVFITDIYSPAGEQKIEGVDSAKLVDAIRQHSNQHVQYTPTHIDAYESIHSMLQPGDILLTMGAGDIWKLGKQCAHELQLKYQS